MRGITAHQASFTISFLLMAFATGPLRTAQSTITIEPGTEIQPLIDASPPGTRYLIKPGIHRLQAIQPKDGDIFEGAPGAILNGARVLGRFQHQGLLWVASLVSTLPIPVRQSSVPCLSRSTVCWYPQDLFLNNVLLRRVESLDEVRSGRWYLNDQVQKIYMADNPIGHTIELSTIPVAFSDSSKAVIIRGLIVEKYANPAQHGAIHDTGRGWVIENNEVRFNHGVGLFINTHAFIRGNNIHHNGQLGIGGAGSEMLLEDNQVAYNNTSEFDYMGPAGEAGGIKVVKSTDLVIRNNFVHHNNGPGIWLDTDNIRWKVECNRLSDNREAGILIETSYVGIIRFNILENEGYNVDPLKTSLWWRAGIMIQSSSDTEAYENTLIHCGNGIGVISIERGSGAWGAHTAKNVYVHDNSIIQTAEISAGLVADIDTDHIHAYSSWNNRFSANRYMLSTPTATTFVWYLGGSNYQTINLQQWQRTGQDRGSSTLFSQQAVASVQGFASGDRIRIIKKNSAYTLPFAKAPLIPSILPGEHGTITMIKGPIYYLQDWWWRITYDQGLEGWSPRRAFYREPPRRSKSLL